MRATRRFSPPEQILMGVSPRRTAQGFHRHFEMAVEIPGVVLVELFLQFGLLGDEGVEVGVGFGEFGVDLIEAREHFDDGLHRFFDDLDDGFGFIEFGFLLEQTVRCSLWLARSRRCSPCRCLP